MSDPTVSAAGMRVLKQLVGNPPQTIADLMEATGVTRTAVTEQLNELVAGGFAARETERVMGRGRPRHLYSSTESALLLLFATSQRLVVPAIWRAIEELYGADGAQQVLRRVGEIVAKHYRAKIRSRNPNKRLMELSKIFSEEGALIDATEQPSGEVVLHKRSCPFVSMLDEKRAVCGLDLEMMEQIVGAPVNRIACRHEGDARCTFEVARKVRRPEVEAE